MKVCKTLDELFEKIRNDIYEVTSKEVTDEVTDVYLDEIENVVYRRYKPKYYVRRRNSGGLKDRSNVHTKTRRTSKNIVKTTITNKTKSNRKYTKSIKRIAESIEHGTGVMREIGARPFTKETAANLKANKQHVEAFKKGMKDKGYNIVP